VSYGAGLRGGYIASGAGSGSRLNEPQSVLDVVKGLQSQYNYNPNKGSGLFGNVFSGIMGLMNPLAGLFTRGITSLKDRFGPEFDRFRQAPTLDRYLNPEKYVNNPYVIGSNPMDTQRFNRSQFGEILNYPEYQKYQDEYNAKIDRDLKINPEMQVFDLRNNDLTSLSNRFSPDITNQVAYVTEQDIARRDMQLGEMQKTNYEDAKDIGLINPNMTEYEYNQLIQGNITKPGTYIG
jgi:hypothetical protein